MGEELHAPLRQAVQAFQFPGPGLRVLQPFTGRGVTRAAFSLPQIESGKLVRLIKDSKQNERGD